MPPPSTLSVGMEVHQESRAVASVANEDGAEVVALGSSGTRQCDLARRIRKLHAQSPHRVFVSEAGPGGYGLERDRTQQGDVGGVVAPSLLPKTAGEQVNTDRRDAVHLARRRRSGALPPVDVPQVAAEARRDLRRAREEARRDLTARRIGSQPFASGRLVARRARPLGARLTAGGARQGSVRLQPSQASSRHPFGPSPHPPHASRVVHRHATRR
jgi:hypothetical protein